MSILLILAAIIVVSIGWNVFQASAAKSGTSFELPEVPERVRLAANAAFLKSGAKASVAQLTRGVTVQATSGNVYRYGTKLGDEGQFEISASGSGTKITARTTSMFVGWHRNPRANSGFYQLVFALTALSLKIVYYRPGASKMWRFQRALERRIQKELRRSGV